MKKFIDTISRYFASLTDMTVLNVMLNRCLMI